MAPDGVQNRFSKSTDMILVVAKFGSRKFRNYITIYITDIKITRLLELLDKIIF